MSNSVIGPIGMPNFLDARSTDLMSAPSLKSTSDSFMYGKRSRLTRNPGPSATTMGDLPSDLT